MRAGDLIGDRYRLIRQLGEGGMGAVWAAKNEAIDRDVAVKVMLPWLARDATLLQRFFTEARICGSIRDSGMVDVIDLGRAGDGSPFIVMELLQGEPLDALFARSKRLAPAVILPILRDVAQTLALAHERGIVHRDLKPANLFLHRTSRGQTIVKVLDFGISKVLAGADRAAATRTGVVLGSPLYMSPEQARGSEIDQRTDVYSLGVVLYEALAGRLPFDAANANAVIIAIATTSPPPLASVVSVPAPVAELVGRCMQRDRNERPADAAQVVREIERLLAMPEAAAPTWTVAPRGQEALVITGVESMQRSADAALQPAPAGVQYPPTIKLSAHELDVPDQTTIPLPPAGRADGSVAAMNTASPVSSTDPARAPVLPARSRAPLLGAVAAVGALVLALGLGAWRFGSVNNGGPVAPAVATAAPPVLADADAPAPEEVEPPPRPTASSESSSAAASAAPSAPTGAFSAAVPRGPLGPSPRSPASKPKNSGGAWGFH